MSRFESNLMELLSDETSDLTRSVILLRLAAYRARTGVTEKVRSEIAEIRQRYADRNSAQLFAHINFAEAMCEFFEHGVQGSLKKLLRSRALSVGCPVDDGLPFLISSWLANSYRILGDWERVGDEVSKAAGQLDCGVDSEGLARISLVLADCFQEIEDYRQADRWYGISRNQALTCGDDSALSAVLYNRSAIRIFNLRIIEVIKDGFSLDDARIITEAASAENYDLYSNKSAMAWVFGLLRGQLLLLKGSPRDALEQFGSPAVTDLDQTWPSVDLVRRADIARCKAAIGELTNEEYSHCAGILGIEVGVGVGWGDLAIASYSVSKAAESLGNLDADKHLEASKSALGRFMRERERERRMLESLSQSIERLSLEASRRH